MFETLSEYASVGFWIMQAVVGLIFIVHGLPKVKNPKYIASEYHAPAFVGEIHGLVEVVGGLLMMAGYYIHVVALIFSCILVGAIYFRAFVWKLPFHGQNRTGWELDVLLLSACVAILLSK